MAPSITQQVDPFDDWETAYSRDEVVTEKSKNAKLWSEANSTKPTYSLQLSSASTSRLPPPTALLPGSLGNTMTILKRPSSAASDNAKSKLTEDPRREKTLVEREKDYEEARRRIYGAERIVEKKSSEKGKIALEDGLQGLNLSETNLGRGVVNGAKRGGRGRGKSPTERESSQSPSGKKVKLAVEGIRSPRGPESNAGGFSAK